MTDISAASMNTRTSLMKRAKASSLFFNLYICVRSIGRLFTPKTRILCLILNSRRVFKNQLYFKVKKSNFGAFFQKNVLLMRYNSESLEIKVVISGNGLLFKDIKITLGLLITVRKCTLYFGKITTSGCQQLQTIELESLLSNLKFEANLSG